MKKTESELIAIKDEVTQMWRLVLSQLEKSRQALLSNDTELALEVASREKRVDSFELKIDSDCENYIALFNPVAIDLRLVLSLIKISSTLERIADFADGIARYVIEESCETLISDLMEPLRVEQIFDSVIEMLNDSFIALDRENTQLAGKILAKDAFVDQIYHQAFGVLADYVRQYPEKTECALQTIILLRKLERMGDHCSNIIEEIVFYVDAKVLKHNKGDVAL